MGLAWHRALPQAGFSRRSGLSLLTQVLAQAAPVIPGTGLDISCFALRGKGGRGKGVLSFELSAKDPQSCQRTDISKDLSNLASTQKGLSLSFNT